MTRAERLAWAIADRLPGLDPAAMAEHRAFREAVVAALAVADEQAVVEQVAAMGDLDGARNPHAVVVARLRQIPRHAAARSEVEVARAAERAADAPATRALREAAERGAVLRAHVRRGVMTRAEALAQIDWEFRSSAERTEAALAAFEDCDAPLTVDAADPLNLTTTEGVRL